MSQAGHECVGACEIDKYARSVYARHFPKVPLWEDARKINPKELPDFECLTAGFPCQAFSIAGTRRGFEDTRGSLFFEIARIAKEKRPRYLLLENVKGLLNHDAGKTFRIIISTLDEMGYDAEWQVLNSKYFVPQNRERVFIIGHLRGTSRRKIFPLGENNKKIIEPKLKRLEGNPNVYNTDAQAGKIYDVNGISPTVSGQRVNSQGWIKEPKLHQLNKTFHDTGRIYHPNGIARSLRANSGGMGSKTGLYAVENKIKKIGNKNPSGIGQSGNVYDINGIAPTLCSSDATRGFNSSGYVAVTPQIKSLGSLPIPFMRRKTEPSQKEIAQYLKSFRKITITELAEKSKIIKTQVEHYFRTDKYGCLPDKKDWLTLKKILSFDNKYDKIMTEYIEDFMTHEMGTRVHDASGLSPTLTGGEKLIAVTKDHGKLRKTKDQSLAIDANYWKGPDNHGQRTLIHVIGSTQNHAAHKINESTSLTEAMGKGGGHVPMIYMAHSKENIKQRIQERKESWTLTDNARDFGILAWSKSTRDWGVEERIKVGEANTLSTSEGCRSQSSMNYVLTPKYKQIDSSGKNYKSQNDRIYDINFIGPTIPVTSTGSKLKIDDGTRIRRLTPKECERLQGFSDDYTKYDKDGEIVSDTQRYKMCGNAVTVPVVKYVAENLSIKIHSPQDDKTNSHMPPF